jgi:histidinol dehydrogenase
VDPAGVAGVKSVVADDSADPSLAACDLLGQAEHDHGITARVRIERYGGGSR